MNRAGIETIQASAAGQPAIEICDASVRFGRFTAVDRVSLRVPPKQVFALLGPNGSGKTTLIRALCGLTPLAEGSASVLGYDVNHAAEEARAEVGYMSQKFSLYEDLTARENIEFYRGIWGFSATTGRRREAELVALTGLEPYLNRRAGRLSGGWKQRLALVCALLHGPRLLFLDEPTADIDPVARRELWDLLLSLPAQGITLFVTTHSMDEAERCDCIGYIYSGSLLAVGTPYQLKQLPVVHPPGAKRWRISGDAEPADTLARLRRFPQVRDATIFGEAVNALVDADCRPGELDLTTADVQETGPNLEDVFVALARTHSDEFEASNAKRATEIDSGQVRLHVDEQGSGGSISRLASVAQKEVRHLLRDPMTLFLALILPMAQLFLLGYAIDMNVRNVPTVVLDQARTQESRTLLTRFENSNDFLIVDHVVTDAELRQAIVAGRAKVGIKIPPHYSRRILAKEPTQILVLVDGSDSSVAAEVVNVSNAIALRESLLRMLGDEELLVEARPRVLFNPDTRSPNFFIPGLIVVLSHFMALVFSSVSIVREKEKETLNQLFMTPLASLEVVFGKVLPYSVLIFIEICVLLFLMRTTFDVHIQGSLAVLLGLMVPFVLASLGIGLLVSVFSTTQLAAIQVCSGMIVPSIFLSGYVFPLDSMPRLFWYVAQALPTTWMIDATRGVVLRGAGWIELQTHFAVLSVMAFVMLALSALTFAETKRIASP